MILRAFEISRKVCTQFILVEFNQRMQDMNARMSTTSAGWPKGKTSGRLDVQTSGRDTVGVWTPRHPDLWTLGRPGGWASGHPGVRTSGRPDVQRCMHLPHVQGVGRCSIGRAGSTRPGYPPRAAPRNQRSARADRPPARDRNHEFKKSFAVIRRVNPCAPRSENWRANRE